MRKQIGLPIQRTFHCIESISSIRVGHWNQVGGGGVKNLQLAKLFSIHPFSTIIPPPPITLPCPFVFQDNICDARTSLSNYTRTVKQALQFLSEVEVSLLPLPALARVCHEKLEETQEILASLEDRFQTHVDRLSQVVLHPFLSPPEVERLQERVLSQLLVRMSTLKAKGYLQLENLSRLDVFTHLTPPRVFAVASLR